MRAVLLLFVNFRRLLYHGTDFSDVPLDFFSAKNVCMLLYRVVHFRTPLTVTCHHTLNAVQTTDLQSFELH